MHARTKLTVITTQLKKAGVILSDANIPTPPTITAPTRAEIAKAVTKAHEADQDPTADATVQKLIAAHILAAMTIGAELEEQDIARQLRSILDRRAEILAQLNEAFNRHSATLQKLAPALGNIPLTAGVAVAPQHAADFNDAYQANQAIERIREAWGAINNSNGNHRNPLTIITPRLRQWNAARLSVNSNATAWELLHAGITLELAASPDDVTARMDRLKKQESKLSDDAEEAFRESNRNAYKNIRAI